MDEEKKLNASLDILSEQMEPEGLGERGKRERVNRAAEREERGEQSN